MKKIAIRLLYILFFILTGITYTFAQQTGSVNGRLKGADGKPIDYATVSLLRVKDSSLVRGTITSEAGDYAFDHILNGPYFIKASAVGYETKISNSFAITQGFSNVIAPELQLTA